MKSEPMVILQSKLKNSINAPYAFEMLFHIILIEMPGKHIDSPCESPKFGLSDFKIRKADKKLV
jgi:hypothetical protein